MMLRLTTFGGVSLQSVNGGPAGAGEERPVARRGLAVLVLLAAGPPAGLSRELITAYLWPESDGERARNALRQTLFALRRELALPDLLVGSGGPILVLNPASLTSDVQDLERARAAGELEGVARLYAGPFLDGWHLGDAGGFLAWADGKRAQYAVWAAEALEALARTAAARGDAAAAAEWWRRLVAAEPLNTRFVLELMAAQVSAGNPAVALRHAQAHEELLRRELGTPPDRALGELVTRIRTGAPVSLGTPAARPAAAVSADPSIPAPRGTERFRDQLARELASRFVLDDAAETAREGAIRILAARDQRHDRDVVLKVIHPSLASQLDVERFVREIRHTGRLLHPHILPLLDSGEVAGRPWFALPNPAGETLRQRLTREGRLPVDEAVRLTRELAEALGHAHAHGIVHRDVSPENVLLAGGHALLTNLGLARALDAAAAGRLTDTGMLVGPAAYMSPEQAGDGEVDGRSDVYSLAAVLFELLAGEPLFSGPTPQAIMAKRAAAPTPDPSRLRDIPRPVATVLRRALAPAPADRYQTMPAFGAALDGAVVAGRPRPAWWRGVLEALGRGRR
jgi:DNA-binding SARP family transcriptional activator